MHRQTHNLNYTLLKSDYDNTMTLLIMCKNEHVHLYALIHAGASVHTWVIPNSRELYEGKSGQRNDHEVKQID